METPWIHRLVAWAAALLAGAIATLLAPHWMTGLLRAVTAYDAAALALLGFYWLYAMRRDPLDTECRAALEDPGRDVALGIVLLAVVFGLSSAVVILGTGPHVATASERYVSYGLGLFAVVAGWLLIHSTFTFRYAHMYYFDSDEDGTAQRGLKFPGTANPSDYDFAYFSFVIGMTFQVSDVAIEDPGVRRIALFHALMSFAYNTTIIALMINLLSSLFR
ncbi:MAG: DUF1345 domain-containing protein [Candidatus Velthaea sp.]